MIEHVEKVFQGEYAMPPDVIEKARVILDIGANVGSFSVWAKSMCPEAKIHAFEPVERNYELLVKNTEDNLTEERVKSAELTNDAARLQHEQVQTAIDAQNAIQSNLGGQNV